MQGVIQRLPCVFSVVEAVDWRGNFSAVSGCFLKKTIVIDAVYAEPGGTGLARYAREVTARLIAGLSSRFRVVVVGTAAYTGSRGDVFIQAPDNVSPNNGGKAHVYRLLWRWFILPRRLSGHTISGYYAPIPEAAGLKTKQVLTVHDLIPLQFPKLHIKLAWLFWVQLFLVSKKASIVIGGSECARLDWVNWGSCRFKGRSRLVHDGIDVPEKLDYKEEKLKADEPPFIMYVGDTRVYKRVDVLIQALAKTNQLINLKVVGKVNETQKKNLEAIASSCGVLNRVFFCGFVDDNELHSLYRSTAAVGLATEAEGFGLVPLEGMVWGAPAVVSDIPVLREVLGNYAHFVPVNDIAAWGAAFDRAVDEQKLEIYEDRVERINFAASYSWQKTASNIESILVEEFSPDE